MKTRDILFRSLVATVVATILAFVMFSFQVRQDQMAVVTRLGRPVRVIQDPGLYFKYPWPVESARIFDRRLMVFESRPSEALTQDKRNVILFVYAAWQIKDPLLFLQSVGGEENARQKLDGLVTGAKNTVLGQYDFQNLASTNRAEVKLEEIEKRLTDVVAERASAAFGVNVRHVGICRLGLPESNTRFVFERMRAERAQIAEHYRSIGAKEADDIRARTDSEATVLVAEAERSAAETTAKAEAEAARLVADAYHRDPDLYGFLRRLDALRKVGDVNTTLLLDTSTPPFDALRMPVGGHTPAPTPAQAPAPAPASPAAHQE